MASRILLADDSITIQKVVNLTFADEGIEVVAVSNGEMAARRMDDVNPDLVLADIFMPGKNGYELCEAIKTNSKFCNVPVVLLVGAFEPFDQAEAKRVHADAHLTKPFESRTLVETVRKLLGTSARPAPPLASAPLAEPDPALSQTGFVDSDGILDAPGLAGAELSSEAAEPHILFEPTPVNSTVSLDFEAAPAERVEVDTSLNEVASSQYGETLPLDPGQLPIAETPVFQANEIQSATDEVTLDVPFWERPTGELVSPPEYREPSAPTGESEVHETSPAPVASSFEVPASVVSDHPVDQPHVEAEPQARTAEGSSPSEFQQQQMVVDFEESLPSNSVEASDAALFDPTPQTVDLDNSQTQTRDSNEWYVEQVEQAANEWRAAHSRDLKTNTLELPDSSRVSVEAGEEAADVFSFEEAPAAEASSLFTADEPLGDVLFDEASEPTTSASSQPASPLDEPALAEFSLELPPEEPASVEQMPEAYATSSRATGELVTADLPLEGQKLVEAAGHDFVASEVFETYHAPEQAAHYESPEPVSEQHSPAGSVADDWTSPGSVVHSTGRLDSTAMPLEFAEVATEDSVHQVETAQASAGETAVEQPVNWESEQMRFAAIDIEASPVADSDSSRHEFHPTDSERGFEITRALVEDQHADSNENGHRQSREVPEPAVELSPMVIDEIVRRVVAQIGDSVIREIAWEIVPDCVERIIEQQTRETLAKR